MKASAFGFPVDILDLRCIVKGYADKKGLTIRQFKNNLPGKDWVASFLKRHKDLSVRFASNIKRKRAEVGARVIEEYFSNLAKELDGIPPENVWNYDETNLSDDPGQKKLITKRGCKYPERVINSTKAAVSIMFCGNATGEMLPPYVVYKVESLWTTWMENGPPQARYNRSKSGWFDSTCFEDWFLSLLLPRIKKTSGRHVVIGDNLSSHLNPAVLEACEANNIAFVALPPNSTHLTQPLDVAYFRPMKITWRNILSDWKEKGKGRRAPSLPKDEFPSLLRRLMSSTSKDNLVAGFRKAGIYPMDKAQVLYRLPSHCAGTSDALDESGSTAELVSQSFLDHLSKARGDGPHGDDSTRRKRQKISAVPGKSLSADDLPAQAAKRIKKLAKKRESTASNDEDQSHTDTTVAQTSASTTGTSQLLAVNEDDDLDLGCQSESDNATINHESGRDTDVEPESDSEPLITYVGAETGPRNKQIPVALEEDCHVIVEYEDRLYPGQVPAVNSVPNITSTDTGTRYRY